MKETIGKIILVFWRLIHNDYPLAPEEIEVNKVKKLIPNLGYKKNYVIHYENLKQYLNLGLELFKFIEGLNSRKAHGSKDILILTPI